MEGVPHLSDTTTDLNDKFDSLTLVSTLGLEFCVCWPWILEALLVTQKQ